MNDVADGRETIARDAGGAMLYDASRLGQPRADVFEREAWRARGELEEASGGRGTVAFLRRDSRCWVLRHYRRGGLVANWLGDRYLYLGESRTRSFREWRLLRQLVAWGLPAPAPVAARYERTGLYYRADLITEELPTRVTLARALQDAPLEEARWRDVGRCIGRFHARGVHHADLNAHNVLLGAGSDVYLLDFDRGRLRDRGSWEQVVLERLQRSLRKVTAALPADRFDERQWNCLVQACIAEGR